MTIRQLVYQTLTGITGTSKIYYDHFPDTFNNETENGLIFTINNPSSTNTFDVKEFSRIENVDIIIRCPSLDTAEQIRHEAKQAIYGLESSSYISYVLLVSEETPVYYDDLKTWELFISIDINT